MTAKVHLETSADGVRIIRLSDPSRRNAIDQEMRVQLSEAVASIETDLAARVLVLRADGPAFCSGADVVETFGDASARSVEELRERLNGVYAIFRQLRDLTIPTIAAVRGPAIGAGLNLALSCDARFGAPDAVLGAVFSRIGLHPGGGCSYFLTEAMGRSRAFRVLMDGGSIDATSAAGYGLLNEIVDDPEGCALEVAHRWAKLEPELVKDLKEAIQVASSKDFDATVDFESWAQAASARSPRVAEAVAQRRKR